MLYEVLIPNPDDPRYDRTFQVEAGSWRSALTAALAQGAGDAAGADLSDRALSLWTDGRGYVVTDPTSRSSWSLRQVENLTETASNMFKAMTGSHQAIRPEAAPDQAAAPQAKAAATRGTAAPAADASPPAAGGEAAAPAEAASSGNKPSVDLKLKGGGALGFRDRNTGEFRGIGSSERARVASGDALVLTEGRRRTGDLDVAQVRAAAASMELLAVSGLSDRESSAISRALEDVFLNSQAIFEPGYEMEDAIDFILDQAADALPCESGAVLFASDDATHLYAAAAFGKHEDAFLDAKLPLDQGLPGTCLRTGVSLCAEDLDTDPRHTPHLREALKLEREDSICLAPIAAGPRSYGVLLLLNREKRAFVDAETNILAYLGQQLGTFIEDRLLGGPL